MSERPASILLIEDNPTARKMFRVTLETEGYRVLEAPDGRSALSLLREERPALVLQDLVLPDHDGFELAKEIRAVPSCADLPIIVMSGFPRLLDRARSESGMFDASLMKPVPPSVLIDLVRTYMPARPPSHDDFGAGKTLLIVDDDPVQLKLARLRFSDLGFRVITAGDGPTALALARTTPPDAVLCDVLMTGMDGYELCVALRGRPSLAGVPIILVSAHYGGKRDEELAVAAGASALIVRSPTLHEAIEAVRSNLVLEPVLPPGDAESFGKHHPARLMAQLDRQARVNVGIAERAALQSAQLSVLASITDALAKSEDIDAALADVLAACLDAGGVTRGALFRSDGRDDLRLSIAMGFPAGSSSRVDQLFGFRALLDAGERGSIKTPHAALPPEDAAAFLDQIAAAMAVVVPVMDGQDRLGVLLLATDLANVDEHDLTTFGRAIAAHIAQALALTDAFSRLKASAEASRALSASLDLGATQDTLGVLATADLAQLCEIRIGGDAPLVHHSARLPPEIVAVLSELRTRYPGHPMLPADGAAISGRRSFLVEAMSDERLRSLAADASHLELLGKLAIGSYLVVPLVAGDHHLGAASFARLRSGKPFRDVDIIAAEDLGRRAAIALDNARLHQAALAANRAKDEFLAIVSHELRSPLNAVLGWAQMLRDGLPESKRDKALSAIERNASAQAALIDDLLDMSRIVSGTMRLETAPVQLGPVVARALESLKPQFDAKEIVLEKPAITSRGVLIGDVNRLQQIVCNLLSNAIKFTPAGGHVAIELVDVGDQISLTVRDNGKGIDPRFLPHVFDRFKQADASSSRAHAGLGLGLAIVRHLVELHGGTITASSPGLGCGAAFNVMLPQTAATGALARREDKRGSIQAHVGKLDGIAILVVDDEIDTREMMVALLDECGAATSSASSAAEALAIIAQRAPHVVLSDLGMPGEDGYTLIRKIRSLPADEGGTIPAVAVSGFAGIDDRKRAMEAGFQKHLQKPIRVGDLLDTVAHLSRTRMAAK